MSGSEKYALKLCMDKTISFSENASSIINNNPQSLLLCMDIKVPGKPYRCTITLTAWLLRIFGRPLGKTCWGLLHVTYICNIGRKDVTDVYQQPWWHAWGYHQIMTTRYKCYVQYSSKITWYLQVITLVSLESGTHVKSIFVGHQKGT